MNCVDVTTQAELEAATKRGEYTVVQVVVASADPATVVGRWTDLAAAEADAARWTDLEAQVA